MDVIKKMQPGDPGTKRYVRQYGEQLLCVRYRTDKHQQKRITTVELIIDECFYMPRSTPPHSTASQSANREVLVRIAYGETALRQKLKHAGAIWLPDQKRWQIQYRIAEKLGLKDRIEETGNVQI